MNSDDNCCFNTGGWCTTHSGGRMQSCDKKPQRSPKLCINCINDLDRREGTHWFGEHVGPFCDVCWNKIVEEDHVACSSPRWDAFKAVNNERKYQDERWPRPAHSHEVESFLVYIRHHLRQAEDIVSTIDCTHVLNKQKVMAAFRKIAALAVAAMEQHGAVNR